MKKNGKKMMAMLMIMAMAGLTACGGDSSGGGGKAETEAAQTEAAVSETEAEQIAVETQQAAESETEAAQTEAAETEAAQTEAAETEAVQAEPAEELPVEGEYTVFAIQNEGYIVSAEEMEMEASLSLAEDGTGSMSFGEDSEDISEWKVEDDKITITMSDGSSGPGIVKNGLIEFDLYDTGELIIIFAQEGADTSGYELTTVEELQKILLGQQEEVQEQDSMLYAYYSNMNEGEGLHLKYQLEVESLNSIQDYDVHIKDGVYYSLRTTEVAGYESSSITFYQDGKAYNLDPEKMTGLIATEVSSDFLDGDRIMMLDNLFSAIKTRAGQGDYTEETREIDGVSYTAEVFPAGEYNPESVFYFDDNGQLVYYIEGAPVIEALAEMGEQVYKVESIDNEVDESVFDISGYEIEEQ